MPGWAASFQTVHKVNEQLVISRHHFRYHCLESTAFVVCIHSLGKGREYYSRALRFVCARFLVQGKAMDQNKSEPSMLPEVRRLLLVLAYSDVLVKHTCR